MSKEKGQRFGGLAAIRKQGAAATAGPSSASPTSPPPVPTQAKPEPFSSHLTAATRRRLKQASAKEGRKQFETLEQAVLEYLDANHPDIQ